MDFLDIRKARILQAVVKDHVLTSRPVGSERLIELYALGCKSATVRNEMAELSDLGYIAQPHTSAGRIPTDRGYRYYVDQLMAPVLEPDDARQADKLRQQEHDAIEALLLQTCRLLSSVTSCLSVATDPVTDVTKLLRVYIGHAIPRHVLLVILLSTGHVEHRLIEIDPLPDESSLLRLVNFINAQLGDRELSEAARLLGALSAPEELQPLAAPLQKLLTALGQTLASFMERRLFLEGGNQILRHPEFQDVQRLEALYAALEQTRMLYEALSQNIAEEGVTIIIGAENAFPAMQHCSVIAAIYHIGARPAGLLGIVGPTRINYDRAAAAVGCMAHTLTQTLTQLALT